ncbi:MAG: DNA polymerase I, partial [Planctomycetes bacterium]|nr:DNA polymerase I [Planctomycetota bacterium]
MSDQICVIIDGHYYAYRYFFGMPKLLGPKQKHTGVTYAFTNLFKDFRENSSLSHIILVFDHKDPTFRHIMYPEYKAHRDPMPDDLRSQMPDIKKIAELSNIPVLSIPGFEADDVIATLAQDAAAAGMKARICSKDKDLDQIITEHISTWDPGKGLLRGAKELFQERGITPEQVIDYLSMIGDSADNVPGIKGVGPKTATKLLAAYETLENVLENTDQLKGKQKENIEAFIDKAEFTKKLIRIVRVPDLPSINTFKKSESIPEEAKFFYEELGFSVSKFFPKTISSATTEKPDYLILNEQNLGDYLNNIRKHGSCAVDTETTGLDPLTAELVGISFAFGEGTGANKGKAAAYLPLQASDNENCVSWEKVQAQIKDLLEDPQIGKIAQNAKYDIRVFLKHGIRLQGLIGDPMIASWLLNPARESHGLDFLTRSLLFEEKIPTSQVVDLKAGQSMAEIDVQTVATYACEDAQCTWRLAQLFANDLKKEKLLTVYHDQELPLVHCLAAMEQRGFQVHVEVLNEKQQHLEQYLDQCLVDIRAIAGDSFNPASPKQVAAMLFDELKLPVIRKTKRGPSTDAKVLEALRNQHELPDLILQFRTLSKLISTYLRTLPDFINADSLAIHTNYQQTGTETGRLSSDHPNLQNIPKKAEAGREIRAAFNARDNMCLLAADYSQIELRVLAHFSGDETMSQAFADGLDIHRFVAAQVNGVIEEAVTPSQRNA